MALTERQDVLLQLLGEMERPIPGADLAALLGVSVRTVRYDIQHINQSSLADLVVADNNGYRIARAAMSQYLASVGEGRAQISNRERILIYLTRHPVTDVYDVMRDCYVSETLARAELLHIAQDLTGRDLTVRVRGARVTLEGSEAAVRRLIGRMVRSAMDTAVGRNEHIANHFPDIDIAQVREAVTMTLARHHIDLSDIHLDTLVVNLAIFLQRYNFPLGVSDYRITSRMPALDAVALSILEALVALYPQRVLAPVDRQAARDAIIVAINGHHPDAPAQGVDEVLHDTVRTCIEDTIGVFSLMIPLDKRPKLFSALAEHIARLTIRDKVLPYNHNGLRESLRSRSPLLYDAAVYLADRLFQTLGLLFPDDEIALLAINLGLYIVPATDQAHRTTAVLVCPRYRTLQDLLLSTLMQRFADRLHIIDVVATDREAVEQNSELVLSTLAGEERHGGLVRISALLADEDITAIDTALVAAAQQHQQRRLSRAMGRFMHPSLFFADVDLSSQDEVIAFLCERLRAQGAVADNFESSVQRREAYSPTAFARRFAVPHAMDFVALRTSVCILIPRKPISWGDADVSLVMLLAINADDYDEFENFYQPLIRLLYEPQRFAELQKTRTFEGFVSYLTEHFTSTP